MKQQQASFWPHSSKNETLDLTGSSRIASIAFVIALSDKRLRSPFGSGARSSLAVS
ncbi:MULTISPECIES: hypothetical protein [unclassified Microcoleus]|uniref:hypothetical protein n=1 Tax=unclassified Microcoleus TaxID=2642155 RepID=UPI001DFBDE67|nr:MULTISPECIES: hypothetical protein [unclassified Microcoleus]MCC3511279.1 hypothetical protein [Microcoleus sp. PH2017_17_BER_D_A]MCC3641903.1 hypothetical protein [Microcoleus sp. PH2017_33_LGB_O_A]MCC3448905.1 hypothetical protein [Microcoleus sp. PH2017_09_SFU_O_A]MCC3474375.1 hypothetical protein [Microcoleus sp. PH2017_13_LAR_U_A]MCC3484993.1 hypothetical protein [Microcoleus sp. PH2017_14_LAR_D_A]